VCQRMLPTPNFICRWFDKHPHDRDNANLAACHGYVLILETFSEEGTRLLDRAISVGKPEDSQLGFYNEMI
jgi:hypothetical protein